jgi:hypothetical protein
MSPPESNARSLRRNSLMFMPLLRLPLTWSGRFGGPCRIGPPESQSPNSLWLIAGA